MIAYRSFSVLLVDFSTRGGLCGLSRDCVCVKLEFPSRARTSQGAILERRQVTTSNLISLDAMLLVNFGIKESQNS